MQEDQYHSCHLNRRISIHDTLFRVMMFTASLLLVSVLPLAAQLNPADIAVVDYSVGLLRLDPITGTRTVLSDFDNPSQGELGLGPFNLANESSEAILVLDPQVNKLFRVNSITGERTVLSDFSDPTQGPVADSASGGGILGIAVEVSGEILVTAQGAGSADEGGTVFRDALLRVDPVTGQRTMFSDFGDPTQGTLGGQCTFGVAVEASGTILVTDCNNLGDSPGGLLFRIDPVTGQRTVLSDFGNPAEGSLAQFPSGIAIEASGSILVAAPFAGSFPEGTLDPGGALFRVDPVSGQRTLLSDFGNATQGATGTFLRNVAVESTGAILVVDQDVDDVTGPGLGALFRVDPVTGQRTVLSDFSNPALGLGKAPSGVALIPPVTANSFASFGTTLILLEKLHQKGHFFNKGFFALADMSDGIEPKIEDVMFTLSDTDGSFFSQIIPSGSFKRIGMGCFLFLAPKDKEGSGIRLMIIRPANRTGQQFTFEVFGYRLDLSEANNPPMTISLQIGDDKGSQTIPCRNLSQGLICR